VPCKQFVRSHSCNTVCHPHNSAGFKTFCKPCYVGPLDSSFSAIVGPNGLGKTVLADAVRFTLGSSVTSIRVKAAKDSVSHQLMQRLGSKAACCTEVGFVIHHARAQDTTAHGENNLRHFTRYLRVRRRVVAAGQSTYSAACSAALPGTECLQDKLPSLSYVRISNSPVCLLTPWAFLDQSPSLQ
jgi:hypothetical protein